MTRQDKAGDIFLKLNAVLALFGAACFALQSYGKILFRYGCNYAEPIIAWACFQVGHNPIIYKHFDEGSATVFAYNPLYAYFVYALSLLTGPTFMAGRLASFIFYVVAGLAAFKLLKLETGQTMLAIVASFFILLIPVLASYACDFRADIMGLALCALGLFFLLRWEKSDIDRTTRDTWLGLLFSTLAFFTRQNYFFGIGAFILFLFSRKHFKQGFFLMQTQLFLFAVPMLLLNGATDGAYYQNVILFNMNKFYGSLIWDSWIHYVPYLFLLYALAFLFLIVRTAKKETGFFDFYLAAAFASTFMIGKIGSDSNYFIEAAFSLGLYLAVLLAAYGDFKKNPALALLLWLLFTGHLAYFAWQRLPSGGLNQVLQIDQSKKLDEVSAIIAKVPGKILSEDMGLLIANRRPVEYEPFEYSQLARRGLWDETQLFRLLDSREFSLIILTTNIFNLRQTSRFTPAMITRIRQNYEAKGVFNGYIFLIPKKNPV